MRPRWIIPFLIVGLLIFGMTANLAQAGPFEKAGLSKSAGRTLTDKEADTVRGGFRGGGEMFAQMQEIMAGLLGVSVEDLAAMSRETKMAKMQGIGRDAIKAAMTEAGFERPEMGQRRAGMSKPPAGFQQRSGFRGKRARMGRRGG